MTDLDVTHDGLEAASSALAGKGPVQMVNLLRYRANATYDAGTEHPPCSG
jgi:hypothetical protein